MLEVVDDVADEMMRCEWVVWRISMDVQNKLYDEYIRLRGDRGQVDIA